MSAAHALPRNSRRRSLVSRVLNWPRIMCRAGMLASCNAQRRSPLAPANCSTALPPHAARAARCHSSMGAAPLSGGMSGSGSSALCGATTMRSWLRSARLSGEL